jgi:hypothetical protein
MGRWKRDGNHSPPKNKLVEDSEGNEKIKYQVPDSNKTEHIERRNLVRTHREFHGDATRQGQPKCTGGTQEIPRQ